MLFPIGETPQSFKLLKDPIYAEHHSSAILKCLDPCALMLPSFVRKQKGGGVGRLSGHPDQDDDREKVGQE